MTGDALGVPPEGLLDALEVAVVVFDRNGTVIAANRRARSDLYILESPVGSVFEHGLELVDEHGTRIGDADSPTAVALRTGRVVSNVIIGVRSQRRGILWVMVATTPTFDDDGAVSGAICTFVDITEQRSAEQALRASEERFRQLAEMAVDVIYRIQVGPAPRFDYVNPAVEAVLGYTPQEFYDEPGLVVRITHDDDVERVRELGTIGVPAVESVQLRMQRRDGTMIWTEHRVVPVHDADGTVTTISGIARDVTDLKLKEAYLSHRALHDPLTGLPNRVLLLDRLEAALARIRRHKAWLAVLYLDLDRFKTVNDNLGHEFGDRLLQVVALRLQETLRPSDSVARLGGDEFAAILPDLGDPNEAAQIAERLLAAVAEPVDLGNDSLSTTVSIGIAGAGDGGPSAAELLRRADFAMYTAKDRGRARIESYDELARDDRPAHEGGAPTSR